MRERQVYLVMTQFEKVSSKVDGNTTKKVDESSNNPLPHGYYRRQLTSRAAGMKKKKTASMVDGNCSLELQPHGGQDSR